MDFKAAYAKLLRGANLAYLEPELKEFASVAPTVSSEDEVLRLKAELAEANAKLATIQKVLDGTTKLMALAPEVGVAAAVSVDNDEEHNSNY